MTQIRIETMLDPASGRVFAEVYRDEGTTPVMCSAPAFTSHDELAERVLELLLTHFPDHFPFADDPTIGV